MVTSRGILTETPAMLAYIAQSFPDAAGPPSMINGVATLLAPAVAD